MKTQELYQIIRNPRLGDERVEDKENWIRTVRTIAKCGLGVSLIYVSVFAYLRIWPSSLYHCLFLVSYGVIAFFPTTKNERALSVTLMFLAFFHIAGSTLLFSPRGSGSHYFLMIIPVLSLVAMHHRDRYWWWLVTIMAESLMVWMSWNLEEYVAPFARPIERGSTGIWRAMAVFVTVSLIVGIIQKFHHDLFRTRRSLKDAYERSESLLRNMLPVSIARRLKYNDELIADDVESASVLFADIVGFTELSTRQTATQTVQMLNTLFSGFDQKIAARGLEKIKTIGDAYMVASGLPTPRDNHVDELLELAMEMFEIVYEYNEKEAATLNLRIGVHSGPLIAGVIGRRKLVYDIWGDTVNVASRMESTGEAGRIQVSVAVKEAASPKYQFIERGLIEVKGRGAMNTFFLSVDS